MVKNFFKKYKGFSLIESLIVISIFSIIAGALLLNLKDTKIYFALEDAQATIINALEEARSQAASGIGDEKYHGVKINPTSISMVEGNDPSSLTDTREVNFPLSVSSLDAIYIIFERINTVPESSNPLPCTITIENTNGDQKNIKITEDGLIQSE